MAEAVDLRPRSELIVPETLVERPRFPATDFHNHLDLTAPRRAGHTAASVIATMDEAGVESIVNLSGGSGDALRRNMEMLDLAYPGRFYTFCNVDWNGVGEQGWVERAVAGLKADIAAGAKGLKVFKNLGLNYRDTDGRLVSPDDPRIADVWEAAGELGVPVLIHSADPVAFFCPLDRFNERWDELHNHPAWHFYGGDYPTFEALVEALYRVIEAHPRTTFVTAHVGCYPENLRFVSEMMDRYPNMCSDFSARIAELGRAPYSARDWLLRYQDRIVFGTDEFPNVTSYRTYFRFLETRDEYFEYRPGAEIQPQGRWRIYGVQLPDEALKKIYRDNPRRLLGLA